MQLSGNKARKLEFLLADAAAPDIDCVITTGGVQSNHCRSTAVAAKYAGLDSYLILCTSSSSWTKTLVWSATCSSRGCSAPTSTSYRGENFRGSAVWP
ncbi:hypothetical protein ZWY2020_018381 [Hordeum vulgare]|nr:hypothetical protein ZWY2020_018381 [Hordeum vulgare]